MLIRPRRLLAVCVILCVSQVFGATDSVYDSNFRKGLQEEAGKNWSGAIQYYLLAQKADPSQPFPKMRIKEIFKTQLREGQNIQSLRVILPPDLENQLKDEGVFELFEAPEKPLSVLWDVVVWGGLILIVGLGVVVLVLTLKKRKEKEDEDAMLARIKSERIRPSKASKNTELSLTGGSKSLGFTKETKVTEKTREEIGELFSNVTSLTQEMKRPNFVEMTEEEEDALKDSDIIKSLAQTLVSEVESKEVDGLKMSKMSFDASLMFEESDVDFFEKEFGATDEDISAAREPKIIKKIIRKKIIKKMVAKPPTIEPDGEKKDEN